MYWMFKFAVFTSMYEFLFQISSCFTLKYRVLKQNMK